MKISYNWLQSFFEKKLPEPGKLSDLLSLHSFEVESVKKKDGDWVLDIDILPNRAHDCAGHRGIVREIGAILSLPFDFPDHSPRENSKLQTKALVSIEVKDKKLCRRYMSRALTDIRVSASPGYIQKRLEACGVSPINSVVDVANYAMLETGQPLHAFDVDKLSGKKLIVRKARKNENIVTLDGTSYDLSKNMLVIADEKKPVCIAGIKGGRGPEVDNHTKNIVLEAANFEPRSIRKTSQKLKLQTDASWRFERELDPNSAREAIDMATCLIQKTAGGQIAKGVVDIYPNKTVPRKISLGTQWLSSFLGIEIDRKTITKIFNRLGFETKANKDKLRVTIPTRRIDVEIKEDLAEEIGRIYGYEKIPSCLPKAPLMPAKRKLDIICQNEIKNLLAGIGFNEVYNYSFIGGKEADILTNKKETIEIANPISQEQKYLRTNLVFGLLNNIRKNKKHFEDIGLFEIGKTFGTDKQKPKEIKKISGAVYLSETSKKANEFYALKAALELLFDKLNLKLRRYSGQKDAPAFCHPERQASISAGSVPLGWIAEINAETLSAFGLKSRAAAFEIDFDSLVKSANPDKFYAPFSKYPAMGRDLAILVGRKDKAADIMSFVAQAGGAFVKNIELFDIYEGKNISKEKKSLAFRITYQANDRTLTDKEINQAQEALIEKLEKEEGWVVRK